jgi:hypothetical protein
MRSGGRIGGNVITKSISLLLAVMMTTTAILAISPFISQTTTAPPAAGVLDITFYDTTPDTQTFPGDENVTMIWLEMTASGDDVQVNSMDFTLGGTVGPSEIANAALWGDSYSSQQGRWRECEFANNPVAGTTFTIPQTGNLKECAFGSGDDFVVRVSRPRFILAHLSMSPTVNLDDTVQLTADSVNTNGTVVGGTGTTAPVQVLSVLYSDDMESGLGGWTTSGNDASGSYLDGLWHLSSGENDCTNNNYNSEFHKSPSTSWWYGHRHDNPWNPGTFVCTFNTWVPGDPMNSTANWGNLTSPEIDTTGMKTMYLTFWHMLWGELGVGPDFDNGYLWLYDGSWHDLSPSPDGYDYTSERWMKETFNLSAYAGKTIKLEFRFDTIDQHNNFFLGWFVDDVTIYGKMEKHAIAVTDIDVTPIVSLPTKGGPFTLPITARISNIGTENQIDILVNLTEDGAVVNQTMIPFMSNGTTQAVLLGWVVKAEGVYEVCIEAWIVSTSSTSRDCRMVTVISIKPRNLQIFKSANTLMLEWLEPTLPTFQGYRIYRSSTVNGFDFMNVYGTAPAGATQWLDPQADAGTDADNYFYILRAFDDQGDEEENTNKVGKFVNQLHKGTNDISVGFELSDNATSAVFESVDGLYESIQAFHAVRCKWLKWTPSGGMLADVDRSMGLRVVMKSEGALVTLGRVVDTVIDLVDTCGGWNFVGYPSFEVGSMPEVLDVGGMAGKYDVVVGYDPTDRRMPWRFFSSGDTAGSAMGALDAGMGIWMHVNQAGVWEVRGD